MNALFDENKPGFDMDGRLDFSRVAPLVQKAIKTST